MKTKYLLPAIFLLLLIVGLSACAPLGMSEQRYGFLFGIIHGVLFYPAVISKIFGMQFDLYAQNNTGLFYWIGYAIGVFGIGGGIFRSRRRR